MIALVIAAAATALGLAVLVLGARGRRINEHPVCRRCRFDLVGVWGGAGGVCPECGTDLGAAGAVQRGVRRRSRMGIVLGLALLLTGFGVGGAAGWGVASGYDWNRAKPAWLLMWEARGPAPDAGVRKELRRRLVLDRLGAERSRALVALALEIQADAKIPWEIDWGLIVELARERGLVSDEQWGSYARNADSPLAVSTFQSPFVRLNGKPYLLPTMQFGEGRGGLSTTLVQTHRLKRVVINGQEVPIPASYPGLTGLGGRQLGVGGEFSHGILPVPELSGIAVVELEWTVAIEDEAAPGGPRTMVERVERFKNKWDMSRWFRAEVTTGDAGEKAGWVPLQNRTGPSPAR